MRLEWKKTLPNPMPVLVFALALGFMLGFGLSGSRARAQSLLSDATDAFPPGRPGLTSNALKSDALTELLGTPPPAKLGRWVNFAACRERAILRRQKSVPTQHPALSLLKPQSLQRQLAGHCLVWLLLQANKLPLWEQELLAREFVTHFLEHPFVGHALFALAQSRFLRGKPLDQSALISADQQAALGERTRLAWLKIQAQDALRQQKILKALGFLVQRAALSSNPEEQRAQRAYIVRLLETLPSPKKLDHTLASLPSQGSWLHEKQPLLLPWALLNAGETEEADQKIAHIEAQGLVNDEEDEHILHRLKEEQGERQRTRPWRIGVLLPLHSKSRLLRSLAHQTLDGIRMVIQSIAQNPSIAENTPRAGGQTQSVAKRLDARGAEDLRQGEGTQNKALSQTPNDKRLDARGAEDLRQGEGTQNKALSQTPNDKRLDARGAEDLRQGEGTQNKALSQTPNDKRLDARGAEDLRQGEGTQNKALSQTPTQVMPELVIHYTDGSATQAAQGVETLVNKHQVVAIIGPIAKLESEKAAERAESLHVPLLSFSVGMQIPVGAWWVFRHNQSIKQEVEDLVRYAVHYRSVKRFALLHPATHYGQGFVEEFWEQIRAEGGKVNASVAFAPAGNRIPRKLGQALRNAFAHIAALGRPLSTKEKNLMEDLKEKPDPLVDFEGLLIAIGPNGGRNFQHIISYPTTIDAENALFIGNRYWNQPSVLLNSANKLIGGVFHDTFDSRGLHASTAAFMAQHQHIYGWRTPYLSPSPYTALGYETMYILRDILQSKGGNTRSGVARLLRQKTFRTPITPTIRFTHKGTVEKPGVFFKMEHGSVFRLPL